MGDEVTGSINVGRRSANGASTRDRLLDSAESVLVRQGSSALTLDAVAATAGVSKGGLLYHFATKDALITALVERAVARIEQATEDAARTGGPGAFTRAYLTINMPSDPPDASERDPLSRDPMGGDAISRALVAAVKVDPVHLAPLRVAYGRWQQRLESDGIPPATATLVRLAVDGWWLSLILGAPPISPRIIDQVRTELHELTSAQPTRS